MVYKGVTEAVHADLVTSKLKPFFDDILTLFCRHVYIQDAGTVARVWFLFPRSHEQPSLLVSCNNHLHTHTQTLT